MKKSKKKTTTKKANNSQESCVDRKRLRKALEKAPEAQFANIIIPIIRAKITKSMLYDNKLTIKVWNDRKGRMASPREAIMEAGYKDGDEVFIVPAKEIEQLAEDISRSMKLSCPIS